MSSLVEKLEILAKNGSFGDGKYIGCKIFDNDQSKQFASSITSAIVTMETEDGNDVKEFHLFIKQQIPNTVLRNATESLKLFHAEIFTYKHLLPLLNAEELALFPKFYYGIATNGLDYKQDICVMQDLISGAGYRSVQGNVFLDYDHIVLALEKLGEFHALSYNAKDVDILKFHDYTKELPESKFCRKLGEKFFYTSLKLALIQLIKQGKEIAILSQLLEKFKDFPNTAKLLLKPEEPFAVICHGDLCHNNLLYKYHNHDINSKPVSIKFVDLQTTVYTTPAIDLAFLLYLNTTAELRDKHWNELLNIYWRAMSSRVNNLKFTFEEFYHHFERRAMYAILPISFFLPVLLEKISTVTELSGNITLSEWHTHFINTFSDRENKPLLDVCNHMLERNYFHKFLEL